MAAAKKSAMARKRNTHSFLLYMAGDNDLSDAGISDIEELCAEGAEEGHLYVAAEIDTQGEHTGSIRYEITPRDEIDGRGHRTVIERLAEQDSGSPRTLHAFLRWGLERYPAKNRVVVIGGHGDGFRTRTRAIGLDEFGSALDIPEIEHVFRKSGLHGKNRISIIGFDACLMCMLEIAHHFSTVSDYLVGSQQTEPGDGWPYAEVLKLLKKAKREVEPVARGIPKVYADAYSDRAVANVTQSAIRLSGTDAAMRALSQLGRALIKCLEDPEQRARIQEARRETQSFALADYIDAMHFAECLEEAEVTGAIDAARTFHAALDECILATNNPSGQVRNAKGLSIWYPAAQFAYIVHRPKYLGLRGVTSTRYNGWLKYLDALHDT